LLADVTSVAARTDLIDSLAAKGAQLRIECVIVSASASIFRFKKNLTRINNKLIIGGAEPTDFTLKA